MFPGIAKALQCRVERVFTERAARASGEEKSLLAGTLPFNFRKHGTSNAVQGNNVLPSVLHLGAGYCPCPGLQVDFFPCCRSDIAGTDCRRHQEEQGTTNVGRSVVVTE